MTQVKAEIKPKINDYWTNESIKKLDGVLQNLGDELDSIMVSGNYDNGDKPPICIIFRFLMLFILFIQDVASGDELEEI